MNSSKWRIKLLFINKFSNFKLLNTLILFGQVKDLDFCKTFYIL